MDVGSKEVLMESPPVSVIIYVCVCVCACLWWALPPPTCFLIQIYSPNQPRTRLS